MIPTDRIPTKEPPEGDPWFRPGVPREPMPWDEPRGDYEDEADPEDPYSDFED